MNSQYQATANGAPEGISPVRFFLSDRRAVSPIYECGHVSSMTLLDMYQLYQARIDICNVRHIDEVYNPICYGNSQYSQEQRDFLYSLPPARAQGLITYSYADNVLPCEIYFDEYCVDGGHYRHFLHLPSMVRNEVLDSNKIARLCNHMLYIPYSSITCEKSSNGDLHIDVIGGKSVIAQPIKSESGWHGVCLETGLPINDGRPHSGHDGKDRYFWRMSNHHITKSGGNGFIGSPVHIYYSPNFYGQNVVCIFGPSVPCCAWHMY